MGLHANRQAVPKTSAQRGKRLSATWCRRCKREWRHFYRCLKYGAKSKLGKSLRFHCNGVWDT
jgi:hypothetical protein